MPSLTSLAAPLRSSAVTTAAAAVVIAAALTLTGSTAQLTSGTTSTPVTPGPISGYGFDQCQTPSQAAMTAWHQHSPFRAAGIYMSGSLRFCHDQPNLTPTWVRTQLAAGWRLLPIHLGRQAACSTVQRYQGHLISANPADGYAKARAEGVAEAKVAVAAAQELGIVKRSTIFYDLESFSIKTAACRDSALWFVGAWTNQLKTSGYVSGVYSSASTGIKMLDDQRVVVGNKVPLPTFIWIADWNNTRNTSSTYLRPDGWPGRRLHQYRGGHDETYGGVTINIDSSVLDLHGFPTCSASNVNRSTYRLSTPDIRRDLVTPLQCQLKKNGYYPSTVTGAWNTATSTAVAQFQDKVNHAINGRVFSRADWVSLLVAGTDHTVLKPGVKGQDVIRAQRALNAATSAGLRITGTYNAATQQAAVAYQKANDISPTEGIIASITWRYLTFGHW
jgi:hypothetical protein